MTCKDWNNHGVVLLLIAVGTRSYAVAAQRETRDSLGRHMTVFLTCEGQRDAGLPLSLNSFQQIIRTKINVPPGRSTSFTNIFLNFYGTNTTTPKSYRIRDVYGLLSDPNFDFKKPTVVYTHGYVELTTDDSVLTIVKAYLQHGGYNIIVVDWANLAFGNYVFVALDVPFVGKETGKAMLRLLNGGVALESLHFIGHSLGTHILGTAGRYMAAKGYMVPRLTGLDPAYPGFYPGILGPAMSASDAVFVEALHTDGGGYGTPARTAHADYWPNEGSGKQPGCLSATLLLSTEDFCSHWRSWAFWAESVNGGEFLARKCGDYDTFLRGQCQDQPLVYIGLKATPDLRGNFYLRTAAKPPYALGKRGAD